MGNKISIIQQLQKEALNPEISVSDLLRKAKIVAVKLNLKDFLNWIEKELNGYDVKNQKELPMYRIINTEIKGWNPFRGWQPVIFENHEVANLLSERGTNQPISELDDIIKAKKEEPIFLELPSEAKKRIIESLEFKVDVKCMVSKTEIVGILDAVRNIILDWSLKLEKEGILGEGLSFSQKEYKKARKPSVIYKIGRIGHFTGTIGNISGNAKVNIHQINPEFKKEIQNLIEQIRKYTPQIDLKTEEQRHIEQDLAKLDIEIKSRKPKISKVKKILSSVKRVVESAAGNVIAQGIIVGIEKFIK